jgi:hypothetical protein
MPSRGCFCNRSPICCGLKGIDGRKTVVFFSEGFYSDNLGRELEGSQPPPDVSVITRST